MFSLKSFFLLSSLGYLPTSAYNTEDLKTFSIERMQSHLGIQEEIVRGSDSNPAINFKNLKERLKKYEKEVNELWEETIKVLNISSDATKKKLEIIKDMVRFYTSVFEPGFSDIKDELDHFKGSSRIFDGLKIILRRRRISDKEAGKLLDLVKAIKKFNKLERRLKDFTLNLDIV